MYKYTYTRTNFEKLIWLKLKSSRGFDDEKLFVHIIEKIRQMHSVQRQLVPRWNDGQLQLQSYVDLSTGHSFENDKGTT